MESKSRWLPSSLSSDSSYSSSSSLGSSRLYGRSSVLGSDQYTRLSSIKLDSEHQSSRFAGTSRDYSVPEARRSSWNPAPIPVSCDHSWAGSSAGSRSKLGDSERRMGSYSGLLSTRQDGDSKRPKLSYTGRALQSGSTSSSALSGSSSSRLSSGSDCSWKSYSALSRASSSSSSSESLRSHRDVEDGTDSGVSAHRSTGLSSLYRPDRLTSSYAQGARPKDSLYSSTRLSASLSHRPSSDYSPSLLSRDSCRSTSRTLGSAPSRAQEVPASSLGPAPRVGSSRSWYTPASERSSLPTPTPTPPHRPASDSRDSEGRRTTRQLLSRLASSVSSGLFSRRSSQDSSGSGSSTWRSESSDDSDLRRDESSSQSADSSRNSSPEVSERRGSEGLAFLRRRRQGLSPVPETRGSRPDQDPGRAPAAWLSSSLRSRCPPLFSRRRREGRDETARMATVSEDTRRGSQPPPRSRGAPETKAADGDRGDDEDEEEEEDDQAEGARAAGLLGATAGVSALDASRAVRRLATVSPNSLFRISVPAARESGEPGPENVMITVDIMASGRAADRQEKEKPASSRDPEKLRKIQESLLLEESDEDEADLCRICQMREDSSANPLLEPCRCTGSLQYVHQDCMKKWLRSKIRSGSNLDAVTTCELCKEKLHLNIDNFDVSELYRTHERSEYELISCGLYLVVLLHLCEQRFSDVLGAATDAGIFNLARSLPHVDDLESGESEEEVVPDNRPSIDFGDLEDDDDEY